MQDKQHADTKNNLESMHATPAAAPTKPRSKVVTFFAKMYSPHGILTCKEFIWPAVYLLTLGKTLLALLLAPAEMVNIIFPLRNADLLYKSLIVAYLLGVIVLIFLYPLYTICIKVLHAVKLKKLYVVAALIISIISIETHPILLNKNTLIYYLLPYSLYICLIVTCLILGKYSQHQHKDTTN